MVIHWSPHIRKDTDSLEQVQRRTTKLINGFKKLSYEDRSALNLMTLEKRRVRDLTEVFKTMTGREKVGKQEFFECSTSTYNLRGALVQNFCDEKPRNLSALS